MLHKLLGILIATYLLTLAGEATMAVGKTHPHLYITPKDIERAKVNVERSPWTAETYQKIVADAEKWASMSEEQLRHIVPSPGAYFAYGFSGCPECGKSWPLWGAGGICDLNHPGAVKCPACGKVFPDEQHPDNGDGWVDPKSGRKYYFVGCYNSYVAQTLTLTALDNLSNAYAITGDERYARTAAIIFDEIARIYPTCTVGSIDYPNAPGGRFERTEYQVARVLVFFARYYDLLYNSPALDGASQAGESTIRKSIEERVLKNGAAFCFEKGNSGKYGLTNGEADYVRGVLSVGLVLDMQEYVDWALTGPYCVFNFLENNLDRDGQYYETSVGYSEHALSLYFDMAEMLINYKTSEHPDGINLYKHPKFANALVRGEFDILCAGHSPRFGDWSPDCKKIENADAPMIFTCAAIERVYHRSAPEDRKNLASMLKAAAGGDVEGARASASSYHKSWLLFHAEPLPETPDRGIEAESKLLDGRGIAILRSGDGLDGRAALVRYGPSVCHGHMDDLNINLYALGRELTYDFGYSLGSAHVQTGWAKQTASHNLVVVNEKSQITGQTGGSVQLFAGSNGIQISEVSSEASYKSEGVSIYRRTLAILDTGRDSSYMVDIFRVSGGDKHDLMWHAYGEKLETTGVELGDVQKIGSLAGPEYDWGTKVGPDGDITGQADKGPYWVAPPQNGYGFLYDVRRGKIEDGCSALWTVDSKAGDMFQVSLLPPPDCELVTASGPAILQSLPTADFAIVRRTGKDLTSTFMSVLQPFNKTNDVEQIERLKVDINEGMPAGISIRLKGDRTDLIMSALDDHKRYSFSLGDENTELEGRFAAVRFNGNSLTDLLMTGASYLSVGKDFVKAERSMYLGRVESVDYSGCRLVVNEDLPTDESLIGTGIYVSRRGYSHKSYYKIASVSKENGRCVVQLDCSTIVLGKGYVQQSAQLGSREIDNIVPLEKSTSCRYTDTGYFNGKLMVSDSGKSARITNVVAAGGKRKIVVPDASIFGKGENLTIYDIQAGDTFEIPTQVSINRKNRGLEVTATTAGSIMLKGCRYTFERGTSVIAL